MTDNVTPLRPAVSAENSRDMLLQLAFELHEAGAPYPIIAGWMLRQGASLLLQGDPVAALAELEKAETFVRGARRMLEGAGTPATVA